MSPSVQLQGSNSNLHSRFTGRMKQMKLPTLRKPKPSMASFSPAIESSLESSSVGTSSESVLDSQSTSITTQSSASLPPPVAPFLHSSDRLRPNSECCSRRQSTASPSPASSLSLSPLSPRILSAKDGQWFHQSLLLVFGQVGIPDKPGCNGTLTVYHHLDGYPSTQWPVSEGYFKALVRLDPGPNKIRFEYNATKVSSFNTIFTFNMLPLTASPPLQLAILVGKDTTEELNVVQENLRMAAYLAQAFTGEQMYRNRLGRRCFRLEEEWAPDTISPRTMRNLVKVHVIRSESTAEEIRDVERAQNGKELRKLVQGAVDGYFGSTALGRYVAVVVLDSKGDLQFGGVPTQSSLSHGLGIVGSRYFSTLPSRIEDVVSTFSNCTRIDGDTNFSWEATTEALGTMMGAFLSPQAPVTPRDFSHIDRTFITKEPYSLKAKSPGLRLSLPEQECSWSRIDCLRFRYHPCFRLPTDPIQPAFPDSPQIYAVENGIVVGARTGITMILIYAGGVYRDYLEYTAKPEREVVLQEDFIRSKLKESDSHRILPVKLKIYSAGQGETIVEDLHATKRLRVQLPNGHGAAFKSGPVGGITDPKAQELILHSITTGRMLTGIRVFHNSASLDGLEFLYEDSTSQVFGHRGSGDATGTAVSDFSIDARKGESLIGFCVRSGGLEILTNFGRRSSFFGNPMDGNSKTLVAPRGKSIAGLAGSCTSGFAILYR